jgi:2-deoxy-D-gluconate 3-dehydrogenase
VTLPVAPSFRLDGRRALVAGASSGIGLAAAVALAGQGAHVVCAARDAGRLGAAVDEMRSAGHSVEALVLDIADPGATGQTLSALPGFDVVVNSAGIARHSPALETRVEDFDAAMAINLRGAYFLAVAAARGMIAAGKPGSIIQISSQMGHVGGQDRAVYCAGKHGLEGMTKAMAIEWGPKRIRVNTLCPTFIRTPLGEQTLAIPERRAWIEGKIKLGRVGELSDIMGAVVYLASDASALVTGTALMVDGGWTAD